MKKVNTMERIIRRFYCSVREIDSLRFLETVRIFLANVHNSLGMIFLAAGKGAKSVLLIPRQPIHTIDIIVGK